MSISACIPTIPSRRALLSRALASVEAQTVRPESVVIVEDSRGQGSAKTRMSILELVETEWVAWLDDDDEWAPQHLETLIDARTAHPEADFLYTWFEVIGGGDPFPQYYGQPYDPGQVTGAGILLRTELARNVGYLRGELTEKQGLEEAAHRRRNSLPGRKSSGDDGSFARRCHEAGATLIHVPAKTYLWHHHDANTGGLPGIA